MDFLIWSGIATKCSQQAAALIDRMEKFHTINDSNEIWKKSSWNMTIDKNPDVDFFTLFKIPVKSSRLRYLLR